MRFYFSTSLLTLIFAIGAVDAFAAASVRTISNPVTTSDVASGSVGATNVGAKPGTTATGSASRAGSMRSVSRPVAKVSAAGSSTGGVASSPTSVSGSSISSGGAGLNRASSTPRLSVGKYIGTPGKSVSTAGEDIDLSGKVDKEQGRDFAGNVLSIDENGFVTNTEEVYFKEETDELLDKKLDNTADADLYEGKALIVTETGEIKPVGELLTAEDIDLSGKVDKNQGSDVTGNVLAINEEGIVTNTEKVYFQQETDEMFAKKLDNTADPTVYGKKALVVDSVTGEIKPTGEFLTAADVDLTGKVDKDQGVAAAGKTLVVNEDGKVEATGDKVDRFQGTNVAGRALVVNDQGYVTTGRINTSSLGLGQLAYEDTVRNELVDDNTLERAKMAESITDTLNWIDSWRESEPTKDDKTRYVMAVDEYGQAAWFRVAIE